MCSELPSQQHREVSHHLQAELLSGVFRKKERVQLYILPVLHPKFLNVCGLACVCSSEESPAVALLIHCNLSLFLSFSTTLVASGWISSQHTLQKSSIKLVKLMCVYICIYKHI